ncbi:YdcH family protein [Shewanella psychrotolerans]|uniref:YdcH family protein n=1 Tax=Shewanella psychrotolerans TaxID=2864206 RepID=UPI001C657C3F|nr:YdcH family protein [Shewanella psychrotolerans]QYK02228.1 YdcH family protein [Shewanella psychrotolerans]
MLGEDHSLINEFPEHQATIVKLSKADPNFADAAKQYNALDKEIRELELNGAPIDDEAMNQLKHDRAELKDALYIRLTQ